MNILQMLLPQTIGQSVKDSPIRKANKSNKTYLFYLYIGRLIIV